MYAYILYAGNCNEMSSFTESKLSKLSSEHESKGAAFVEHTRKFLVRSYPAGGRVDSSNYSPTEGIVVGGQMVALNFQTRDLPLESYLGLFRDNNACGYVLKPNCLLERIVLSLLALAFISSIASEISIFIFLSFPHILYQN